MWTGGSTPTRSGGRSRRLETLSLLRRPLPVLRRRPTSATSSTSSSPAGRTCRSCRGRACCPASTWAARPTCRPARRCAQWLERTKTPFYILTNYATGNYTDKTGPATYAALTGPLAEPVPRLHPRRGDRHRRRAAAPTSRWARPAREHVDALRQAAPPAAGRGLEQDLQDDGARGPLRPRASRACRSISIALAHLFHEHGVRRSSATRSTRPTSTRRCGSPSSAARPGSTAAPGSTTPAATSATPATTSRRSPSCRAAPGLVPQQVRDHRRRERLLVSQAVLPELPRRRVGDLLGAEPGEPVDPARPRHAPDPALALRPGDGGLPGVRRPAARPRRAVHADRPPAQLRPRLRARELRVQDAARASPRTRATSSCASCSTSAGIRPACSKASRPRRTCRACPAACTATSSTCWSIGRRGPRRSSTTRSSGRPATWTWPAWARRCCATTSRAAARWW